MKEFFAFFRLEKVFENLHTPSAAYSASLPMVNILIKSYKEDFIF